MNGPWIRLFPSGREQSRRIRGISPRRSASEMRPMTGVPAIASLSGGRLLRRDLRPSRTARRSMTGHARRDLRATQGNDLGWSARRRERSRRRGEAIPDIAARTGRRCGPRNCGRVLETDVDRPDGDVRLRGDDVDAGRRYADPGVDDDALVQNAVEDVDDARSIGRAFEPGFGQHGEPARAYHSGSALGYCMSARARVMACEPVQVEASRSPSRAVALMAGAAVIDGR